MAGALSQCSALTALSIGENQIEGEGYAVFLRACYAMSGTDAAYGAIRLCAISGTDMAYGAIRLCAMSGTDVAAKWMARGLVDCQTLTAISLRWSHPAYARAMRCPVLTSGMILPGVEGVDLLAGAMRRYG
eukprot:168154-Rhodomonas_salina.3